MQLPTGVACTFMVGTQDNKLTGHCHFDPLSPRPPPSTGYIRLELPVFHIGYFRNTIQLLQCICKSCSRVLLPDDERKQWLRRFRNPRVERVQREGMFKKVWGV